jgi:ketosteroid isomerase-like protein
VHRNVIALVASTAVLACSSAPERQTRQEAHVDVIAARRAIDSTNAQLVRWYSAGFADSVASAFALDARQMPPNSPPSIGRDSIRAYWARALPLGKWTFDLETDEVIVADSIAAERGHYHLTFAAGKRGPIPSFEDRGNYVVLWRLEPDAKWRIVWDAPVSVLPPPGK